MLGQEQGHSPQGGKQPDTAKTNINKCHFKPEYLVAASVINFNLTASFIPHTAWKAVIALYRGSAEIRGSCNDLMLALLWMKRWGKRGREHISPLGSLEAAVMKLFAAIFNLSSYTFSDGWRRSGTRQKYLAQTSQLFACFRASLWSFSFLMSFPI